MAVPATLRPPTTAPATAGAPASKWKVLVAVVFGIFMVMLDTTVVNVAFPALRAEFGASLGTAQWIVSVYVLALGVSTPVSGYLADRFGMKRTYLAGLAIFAAASALAWVAPWFWLLVVARALQGVGGGIAVPLGSATIVATFPPGEQGKALGVYGATIVLAPAAGPVVGGMLVDHGFWRWVFFLNVPIGALGMLLGSRFLRERRHDARARLDVPGLLTSMLGFGALLYAASVAAELGWAAGVVRGWLAVGVLALAAFVVVELRLAREPLLDLRLFTNRVFLNATAVGYVTVVALFAAEFLLPLYLQTLRGLSGMDTGIVLLPLALMAMVGTPLAGRLYDRIGPRSLVAVGFALLALNTWQLSRLDATTSLRWIMVLMAIRGLALGLTVQTTFTTALGTVPIPRAARGSSLINGTRQTVQALGVAILATLLASTLSPATRVLQRAAMEPGPGGHPAAHALCAAATRVACAESLLGFERTYRFTFHLALAALALGVLLPGWPLGWAGRRGYVRE